MQSHLNDAVTSDTNQVKTRCSHIGYKPGENPPQHTDARGEANLQPFTVEYSRDVILEIGSSLVFPGIGLTRICRLGDPHVLTSPFSNYHW